MIRVRYKIKSLDLDFTDVNMINHLVVESLNNNIPKDDCKIEDISVILIEPEDGDGRFLNIAFSSNNLDKFEARAMITRSSSETMSKLMSRVYKILDIDVAEVTETNSKE